MKTTFKLTKFFAIALLLSVFACSSDDDGDGGNDGLSAQNLVAAIDENPANGQIVGTVQTAGGATLSFSITSQTPAGALSINATTGELAVSNAEVFDFETNPMITADVSITDTIETVTATVAVNLNDVDDIASFLSASEAAYTAAADGDWVTITEAEYNALALSLNQITKGSISDSQYNAGPTTMSSGSFTFANNNGFTVPSGSFVFAVKYNLVVASPSALVKLKQSSTSISDGFTDLGNAITALEAGDNYAVLKGSNSATTATGYIGLHDSSGNLGYAFVAGNVMQYSVGDGNALTLTQAEGTAFYQALSTTQKQW